jgi:hypothetical protein
MCIWNKYVGDSPAIVPGADTMRAHLFLRRKMPLGVMSLLEIVVMCSAALRTAGRET